MINSLFGLLLLVSCNVFFSLVVPYWQSSYQKYGKVDVKWQSKRCGNDGCVIDYQVVFIALLAGYAYYSSMTTNTVDNTRFLSLSS